MSVLANLANAIGVSEAKELMAMIDSATREIPEIGDNEDGTTTITWSAA